MKKIFDGYGAFLIEAIIVTLILIIFFTVRVKNADGTESVGMHEVVTKISEESIGEDNRASTNEEVETVQSVTAEDLNISVIDGISINTRNDIAIASVFSVIGKDSGNVYDFRVSEITKNNSDSIKNGLVTIDTTTSAMNGQTVNFTQDGIYTLTVVSGNHTDRFALSVTSVNNSDNIEVKYDNISLHVGETANLNATSKNGKALTYTTGNTTIATVDGEGNISAIGIGTTSIKIMQGSEVKIVTINVIPVPVESVTLSSSMEISEKQTVATTTTIIPENATYTARTYTVDDPTIATVDLNGNVTGVKEGTTTMRVSVAGIISNEITIKVTKNAMEYNINTYVEKNDARGEYELIESATNKAAEGSIVTVEPTEKIGYTLNTTTEELTKEITDDTTFSVYYNLIDYNIFYDLNNMENNDENVHTYTVEDTIEVKPASIKDGEFLGWFENGQNLGKTFTIEKGSTGNRTFTAKWQEKESFITFDANGGNGTMNSITVKATAPTRSIQLTKNDFTRERYVFVNWNTKADGSGKSFEDCEFIDYNIIPKDTTLYAQWKYIPKILISFEANGGNGDKMKSIEVTESSGYVLLTHINYQLKEYSFSNWNTKANGTGQSFGDGLAITWDDALYIVGTTTEALTNNEEDAEIVLYAQWSAVPTIVLSYNANKGSGSMQNVLMSNGDTHTILSPSFTRYGYDFVCYNTRSDGNGDIYNPGDTFYYAESNNKNVTLFAIWAPQTYTIEFNGNGATSGSMTTQSMTWDQAATLTANKYARTNYSFDGWSTSPNSGVVYANAQSVLNIGTPNGKLTLYAHWKLNFVNYKVYHYYETSLGSNNYGNPVTRTYQALPGTTVTPALEGRSGYVNPAQTSAVVRVDGTTYVSYYYTLSGTTSYQNADTRTPVFVGVEDIAGKRFSVFSNEPVSVATWTMANDQDDLEWRSTEGSMGWSRNGSSYQYALSFYAADHTSDLNGKWNTHIYNGDTSRGIAGIGYYMHINIYYDTKGGTGVSSQSKYMGHGLNLQNTSKSGYTFLGWSPYNNDTIAYYSGGQRIGGMDWNVIGGINVNTIYHADPDFGNVTLYAVWRTNPHSSHN